MGNKMKSEVEVMFNIGTAYAHYCYNKSVNDSIKKNMERQHENNKQDNNERE